MHESLHSLVRDCRVKLAARRRRPSLSLLEVVLCQSQRKLYVAESFWPSCVFRLRTVGIMVIVSLECEVAHVKAAEEKPRIHVWR